MSASRELVVINAIREGLMADTCLTDFFAEDKRRQGLRRTPPFATYTVISSGRDDPKQTGRLRPMDYENVAAAQGADPPYSTDVLRLHRHEPRLDLSCHIWADPDASYDADDSIESIAAAVRGWLRGKSHLRLIQVDAQVLDAGTVRVFDPRFHTENDALAHRQFDLELKYGETIAEQIESVEKVVTTGHVRQNGEDEYTEQPARSVVSDDFIDPE